MHLLFLLLVMFCLQCFAQPEVMLNKIQQLPEAKIFAQTQNKKQLIVSNPFASGDVLKNKIFYLHYANAAVVQKEIDRQKSKFLSAEGELLCDVRTNSLWVADNGYFLHKIADFIRAIDIPARQIMIAAKIVNINENYVKELGFKYGTSHAPSGNTTDLLMDLPSSSMTAGEFGFVIAKLSGSVLLDMELKALQSEGHGKIISEPKLLTLDRLPALIETGAEVPYQEKTGQGNTSIAFKKAVLGLKVTPEIISQNRILLKILVNQDKVSDITVNGVPAIDTREIKTAVVVKNNETVVLGGIYETTRNNKMVTVPFLGSIPILGALFSHKDTTNEQRELLIFITPKIL